MTDSNDAYAENLARVNEVQDVIASDDICNSQGQIIAKKGTRIDNTMVERITRFKLLRPLESTIVIENELNADSLCECFEAFLQSDESTAFFFQKYYNKESLRDLCQVVCDHDIIRQKITVTSLLMPQVFEQAMFCAWFGYLITQKTKATKSKAADIFLAAMCHDLGMIHISSEVLNKQEALTIEEWRQIHAHPVIAYNILKEIPKIPKPVIRAVFEHHENIDGSGYPRSKPGANLCVEGQLLNLLDGVNAIYNRRFKPHGRPLSDVIPIVQISRHSRFGPLGKKLIVLLRELPSCKDSELPKDKISQVIQAVKDHGQYIDSCVNVAESAAKSVGHRNDSEQIASIQNAIIHISMSIIQSGVVNEAYMRWLDQVQQEDLDHAYKEMEDAFLMMQEIIYQINTLKKLMGLYVDKDKTSEASVVLQERLLQLNVQKVPKVTEELNQLWLFG